MLGESNCVGVGRGKGGKISAGFSKAVKGICRWFEHGAIFALRGGACLTIESGDSCAGAAAGQFVKKEKGLRD